MENLVKKHPLPWEYKMVFGSYGYRDEFIEDANGNRLELWDFCEDMVSFINENYNKLKEINDGKSN